MKIFKQLFQEQKHNADPVAQNSLNSCRCQSGHSMGCRLADDDPVQHNALFCEGEQKLGMTWRMGSVSIWLSYHQTSCDFTELVNEQQLSAGVTGCEVRAFMLCFVTLDVFVMFRVFPIMREQ